jgi:hypothetical protein
MLNCQAFVWPSLPTQSHVFFSKEENGSPPLDLLFVEDPAGGGVPSKDTDLMIACWILLGKFPGWLRLINLFNARCTSKNFDSLLNSATAGLLLRGGPVVKTIRMEPIQWKRLAIT